MTSDVSFRRYIELAMAAISVLILIITAIAFVTGMLFNLFIELTIKFVLQIISCVYDIVFHMCSNLVVN